MKVCKLNLLWHTTSPQALLTNRLRPVAQDCELMRKCKNAATDANNN
jgi:hypothetical protein